jgi:hypothetical protein
VIAEDTVAKQNEKANERKLTEVDLQAYKLGVIGGAFAIAVILLALTGLTFLSSSMSGQGLTVLYAMGLTFILIIVFVQFRVPTGGKFNMDNPIIAVTVGVVTGIVVSLIQTLITIAFQ